MSHAQEGPRGERLDARIADPHHIAGSHRQEEVDGTDDQRRR